MNDDHADGAAPRLDVGAPVAARPAPPATGRPRLAWVDTGRGVAIVLVVLFHAANWFGVPQWQAVNEALAPLRMPLFFALSGMFAGKWLQGSWRALWRSKIALFLWVFLVWETIGSAVFLLGLQMQGIEFGILGTLRDLAISPVRPRFELWFIWALALFFVLAKASRRASPTLQLGLAAVASAVALSGVDLGNVGWNGLLRYYLFFLVGILARERVLALAQPSGRRVLVGLAGSWVVVTLVVVVWDVRAVPGVYFVLCLLGLPAGVALSLLLQRVGTLGSLGRQTLPIYLAHTPIIITAAFLATLAAGDPSPGGWGPVIVPVASVAATWLALWLHRTLTAGQVGRLVYEPPEALRRLAGPGT